MITQIPESRVSVTLTPATEPVVRPARLDDIEQIAQIVNEHARQGHLLPRSAEHIRATLPDWVVAEFGGAIVGCGSLVTMNPTLVEVRSLAVVPAYRSYGIGGKIVQRLVDMARERGIPTVFALTRAVPFFERQGFHVTNKERFPEKVWRDCAICPLQDRCDETAVALELH